MTSLVSHADANRIVREQFRKLLGREATDLEAIYIQAVGWLESHYGRAPGQHAAWADEGFYNWANIEKNPNSDGSCSEGWAIGKDGSNTRCFRVFSSDSEAAQALVRMLTKRHWPVLQAIAAEGTPEAVAKAMKATSSPKAFDSYYESSAAGYAAGIRGALNTIGKEIPVPKFEPSQHVTPPSRRSAESSGWWWQLPVLATIAYQVTKWGRRR